MTLIYQTDHFVVEARETPFVDYEDGGEIRIRIKDTFPEITDRTKLTPQMAIEYIRLSMVIGQAFEKVMNDFHIPIVKINYQEMGNRYAKNASGKPFLHEYIFARSKDAKKQPRPESVYLPDRSTGFYNGFRALLPEHIDALHKEITSLFESEKYLDKNRNLK